MAINDFGKKIGGARKDLWKSRGLRIEDIGDFNLAERDKYITKANVWPKLDYEKMLNEEGYSRDALYFIKAVRDAIPTSPILGYVDSPDDIAQKQEAYLKFVSEFKEELLKVKTAEDIARIDITYFEERGYVRKPSLYSAYKVTHIGEAFINNKLFKAVQMNAAQAQRDATKKGFLANQENSIKSEFAIHQINEYFSNEDAWWNKNGTAIKMERYGGTDYFYPAHEEVAAFLKGVDIRDYIGNYLIVRQGRILGITHDEKEAHEFVDRQVQQLFTQRTEQEKASKEAKKADADRKKNLAPPMLQHITRKGPEMRVGNVVGDDFLKDFNIRGGEFGNWLNEKERQTNMNMAYDSFKDMAKALKIKDEDIAMGNKLSIAFGARGRKGAAAHYEALREVINLTKMHGAGSLAHEMFHAMDDISGKAMGHSDFATKHRGNAFADLVQAMRYKEVTLTPEELNKEALERADNQAALLKKELLKMVPDRILSEDKIAERDKLLEVLLEKVKNPEVSFSEMVFGRTGKPKTKINEVEITDISKFIDENSQLYKMTPHNKEWLACKLSNVQACYQADVKTEPETRRVETEFYKNSKTIDGMYSKAGHGYWSSEIEMAARAFACYLHDRMNDIGIKNDYLTGHAFQKCEDSQGNIIAIYPRPIERLEINKAFDKVIEQMKELGIFHEREENQIAAETPNHYITVQRTENAITFSVLDKDFNEVSGGTMLPEADMHAAIKNAVALNERGAEVKEIDYNVFEEKRRQRERELALGAISVDESSYKQLTLDDMLQGAAAEKQSRDNQTLQEKQFEIIQQTNPMHDDMHVGIRSIEDIKTFEEAARDSESFCYGDFEREDAEIAITTGEITVYSSKPIEQGGFVSTSYNMAKDYAGNGQVYSKTVSLKDVAWINGDEGQYAKVPDKELKRDNASKSEKDER